MYVRGFAYGFACIELCPKIPPCSVWTTHRNGKYHTYLLGIRNQRSENAKDLNTVVHEQQNNHRIK